MTHLNLGSLSPMNICLTVWETSCETLCGKLLSSLKASRLSVSSITSLKLTSYAFLRSWWIALILFSRCELARRITLESSSNSPSVLHISIPIPSVLLLRKRMKGESQWTLIFTDPGGGWSQWNSMTGVGCMYIRKIYAKTGLRKCNKEDMYK